MDIPHEQLDSLALLTPKGVRGWVRNPKRKLPKDVRLSIKLERQLVHLVPRLKKMESKGTGEEKLILYLENLLKKVRKHLRSSAKRDAARAAAHREKYGPLAGSSARGRSNCSSGSVRTVQGGAPGLGKRS